MVVPYKGTPEERRQIYKEEMEAGVRFNVLLTTYSYVMRDRSSLSKITWEYIIVDGGWSVLHEWVGWPVG